MSADPPSGRRTIKPIYNKYDSTTVAIYKIKLFNSLVSMELAMRRTIRL